MPDYALPEIDRFSRAALAACGVPEADAAIVAESITFAHATGKGTHGLGRLPIYARKIRQGLMSPATPLTQVGSPAPACILLDAGHGFGQVAAIRGMGRACDMARAAGIGLTGIRHSNNFGTAAFVAAAAVARGMAGIVMSNAGPAIAPTGGRRPVFGTNPIAVGAPGPADGPPILLDMATSQAARGKIRLAAAEGRPIPEGWAIDADGRPTTDPQAALAGAMLPLGGAKGYGLSMVVDLLAGLMTGSAFGGAARPLGDPVRPSDCGHLLIAIDVARFVAPDAYAERIATLRDAVRAAGDPGAVHLPGERSGRYMDGRDGRVPVSDAIAARLDALAAELDVAPLRPAA